MTQYLPAAIGDVAWVFFFVLLVCAVLCDLCWMRIPNWLTAMTALLFPLAALATPVPVAWMSHLAAGGLVFGACVLLFLFGWMGGGDVKLLGGVALWVGLARLPDYVVLVILLGGMLTTALVLVRWLVGRMVVNPCGLPLVLRSKGVPYGVAISGGAFLMFFLPQ
jgi:prepilin peptidase CpaA